MICKDTEPFDVIMCMSICLAQTFSCEVVRSFFNFLSEQKEMGHII